MRFPFRIFLPFLLILFAIASPLGDFEQEQHEGAHPASSDLTRPESSSNASDYANLSVDQLKTELNSKRVAEKKEKEAYDAAEKAVNGTKLLLDAATRNLTEKEKEWKRLQGIVDKIDEADRNITEKRKEVKRISDSIAFQQEKLAPFETSRDKALRDIDKLNNIDTVLADAIANQTEQQNEINRQNQNVTTLKGIAAKQERDIENPKKKYYLYENLYKDEKCGTAEAKSTCDETKNQRDQWKGIFVPANETWTRFIANYKEAENTVITLTDFKTNGIDDIVTKLQDMKDNPDYHLKRAKNTLIAAENGAKPFNETLLREQELQPIAEKALQDAIEAKNEADGKMSASEVNDARVAARMAERDLLKANTTKTALDEQLKAQQETLNAKEKEWNHTKSEIAALQAQYDIKTAPSTGGIPSYLWYILGGLLLCGLVLAAVVGAHHWKNKNRVKIVLSKYEKEKISGSSQSSAKSSSIAAAAPGPPEQAKSVPEKMVDCGEETITNRLADEGAKESKPPTGRIKVTDPKDLPQNIRDNPKQYPIIEKMHKTGKEIIVEANNSVCIDLDVPKGTMHVDANGSHDFHIDVDSLPECRTLDEPFNWAKGPPIDFSVYDEMEGNFFLKYDISGQYAWSDAKPNYKETIARFKAEETAANDNIPEPKPNEEPPRDPGGRSPISVKEDPQLERGKKKPKQGIMEAIFAYGWGHTPLEGLESTDYYKENYGKYWILHTLKNAFSQLFGMSSATEEDDSKYEYWGGPEVEVKPDETEQHQQSRNNGDAKDKTKQQQESSSGDKDDAIDTTQESTVSPESIAPVLDADTPRMPGGASNISLIEKADNSEKTQKTQVTGVTGPEPAPANAPQSDPSDMTARDNTATGKAKEEDEQRVARIPDAPQPQPSNDRSLRTATAIGKVQTSVRKSPSVSRGSKNENTKKVEERRRESKGSNKKFATDSKRKLSGTSKNTKRKHRGRSSHTKKTRSRGMKRSHDRDDSEDSFELSSQDSDSGKTSILGAVLGAFTSYRQDTFEARKLRITDFLKLLLTSTITDFSEYYKDVADVLIFGAEIFMRDPKVMALDGPTQIDGDTHGNLPFLRRLLCSGRRGFKWLFLGDYVDRGVNSLQVFLIVVLLKILYPKLVIVLRGNHEDPTTNIRYGFKDEILGNKAKNIRSRFKNKEQARDIWKLVEHLYARMPVAAVLGNIVYCSHGGGIPKGINNFMELNELIPRFVYDTTTNKFVETILWSDMARALQESIANFTRGGAGLLQCEAQLKKDMKRIGIELIIRGHQCPNCGHEFFLGWDVLTIFGSTKYNVTKDNFATVVLVNVTPKGKIVMALSIIAHCKEENFDPETFGPDMKAKICRCKHETIHYTAKKDSVGELGTGSLTLPPSAPQSSVSDAALDTSMTAIDGECFQDDPESYCSGGPRSAKC